MKKLVMVLVPAMMFGCGSPTDANGDGIADGVQTPNNVSVVVPATPKGTVSGQVLTTQQKPLTGVIVAMTVGSSTTAKTAATDDAGNFTFQDVPGGAQVLLTFSKEGYTPLRAYSRVPTEAGNVPINNGNASFGPVVLSQNNGTVKFTLVAPTGRPAVGVKASLEVSYAGTVLFGPTDSISSTVVAEATADAQGVVTFTNVPPPSEIDLITSTSTQSYRLVAYAYDADGDGVLESNGLTRTYTASDLLVGANAKPLNLAFTYDPGTPLGVSFSNLTTLKGGSRLPQFNMLKPGDSIYIGFNQPVQPNSVIVGLTDEYGKDTLAIAKSVTNGGTVLMLTPQNIQAGKEYNLYYRAVSENGGTFTASTISFFGGDIATPLPISIENVKFQEMGTNNGLIDSSTVSGAGEDVYVTFNQVMAARLNPFVPTFAYVYIGADLNGSGKIGDAPGERDPATGKTSGVGSGFQLVAAEPTAPIPTKNPPEDPVFRFGTSGYTTRFKFKYTGNYLNSAGTPVAYTSLNPVSNFPVYIIFSALSPTSDAYESGWGVAQTSDITLNASSITPINAVP